MKLHVPPTTLNISRAHMPQIRSDFVPMFKEHLKNHGVKHKNKKVDPKHLKATQGEFNMDKVKKMMKSPPSQGKPILISNDGHVLDGHHRWLADLNCGKKCDAIEFDLPIMDLLHTAKTFGDVFYKPVVEQRLRTIKTVIRENLERRKVL